VKWVLLFVICSQYLWTTKGFVPFESSHCSRGLKDTSTSMHAYVSSEEVRSRLVNQLKKLREKDRQSTLLLSEVSRLFLHPDYYSSRSASLLSRILKIY
jgi:hypothetical protein